jgi:hypothetical protein
VASNAGSDDLRGHDHHARGALVPREGVIANVME